MLSGLRKSHILWGRYHVRINWLPIYSTHLLNLINIHIIQTHISAYIYFFHQFRLTTTVAIGVCVHVITVSLKDNILWNSWHVNYGQGPERVINKEVTRELKGRGQVKEPPVVSGTHPEQDVHAIVWRQVSLKWGALLTHIRQQNSGLIEGKPLDVSPGYLSGYMCPSHLDVIFRLFFFFCLITDSIARTMMHQLNLISNLMTGTVYKSAVSPWEKCTIRPFQHITASTVVLTLLNKFFLMLAWVVKYPGTRTQFWNGYSKFH